MVTGLLLAAEGAQNNPLRIPLDELIIGTLAFLIVFALLGRLAFPNIKQTLDERTDAIEGGIQRAIQTQEEAQRTLEQYRAQLAQARHEAAQLREKAREDGAAIIAEMREEAARQRESIIAAGHQQIEADRRHAAAVLRTEVGQLATELASRIVGEALADEARQGRLVDRFLDELEESERASQTAGVAAS